MKNASPEASKARREIVVAQPFRAAAAAVARPEGLRCRVILLVALIATTATLLAQDGQWLMYSGSFSSHRFSPLAQLTPSNVARLKPVWV